MANRLFLVIALGACFLPAVWSLVFRRLALRSEVTEQVEIWLTYRRRMRVLNRLAIPVWWSLYGWVNEYAAKSNSIPNPPGWVLFVAPLSAGILLEHLITNWSDCRILGRRWRAMDLFRLSFWGTLSLALPLLIFAVGIDAFYHRSIAGILWIVCAGILSLVSTVCLRTAEGLSPRAVKSGELFKRSFALAKRVGVPLERVSVVPFGRGRLTNAFGGARGIALTDDYGRWLHDAQLDFVIGHELAHVQRQHGPKKLKLIAALFLGMALLTLALPGLPLIWRILFNFSAILLPLLTFYFVSKRFEFAADRISVGFTGDGRAGIRALASMYRHTGAPARCASFEGLFSTHPDLWQRIKAIAAVGRVSDEFVAGVQKQFRDRAVEEFVLR